ncbi:hypothetical protein [Paenibacillus elgii]|nr:hypothetical protein [Paenibacillus elgii]
MSNNQKKINPLEILNSSIQKPTAMLNSEERSANKPSAKVEPTKPEKK